MNDCEDDGKEDGLPSHEGSGLKFGGRERGVFLPRLPSHEGSGLKSLENPRIKPIVKSPLA